MSNALKVEKVYDNFCKSCMFYNTTPSKGEKGCIADRLKKIELAKNPVGFCTLYRPKDLDTGDKTREEFLEFCKDQVGCTFGIILYDDSKDKRAIRKTIDSIAKVNYPKEKFFVVLSVFEKTLLDRNSSIPQYVDHYNELSSHDVNCQITFHKDFCNVYDRESEIFQKIVDKTHFINMDAGSLIDEDFLKFVNDTIQAMEKSVVTESPNGEVTCIPKSIANRFYLNYKDYRKMLSEVIKESKKTDTYFKYEK